MEIRKLNFSKILIIFLLCHLIIWTIVPSISNNNLPLDVIEAIAWSDNWPWGWDKHPPLSSWFPGFFFKIFGSQDWSYYLLSQLFVVLSFYIVWKLSLDFFKNKIYSLISVLLLEGIFFYNFTTPEFNVNVCQLPFWALTVYYCWNGIKKNDYITWLIFGAIAALGVLSKYLFVYLLFAIDIYFIYLIINKKFNFKCLVSLISFFLILIPHLVWLFENDFITIVYGVNRAGASEENYLNHFLNPFIFLVKQIGILIPFFAMCLLLISKFKNKIKLKDKKLLFLLIINFVPIILMFITSLLMGAKIRTMWMTPFYLFFGILFLYAFQIKSSLKKLQPFFSVFLILFLFSPIAYLYVSITQTDKRTDYPGKEIAKKVEKEWENNFSNKIGVVGGDEWHGGNLFYHLKSKPKWDNILKEKKINSIKNNDDGFVLIGESDILSKICKGVFFKTENQGICMIGNKK